MDKDKKQKIHPVKTGILNHFPDRTGQIFTNVLLFLLSVFSLSVSSADNGVYTESGQSVSADISDNSGNDALAESEGTVPSKNTEPSPSVEQEEKNILKTDDRKANPANNVSTQPKTEAVQEKSEVVTLQDNRESTAATKEDSNQESSPAQDNSAADSIPEAENKEQQSR